MQGSRMASVDAAWYRMESPVNPMMVTGLFVFHEPLDLVRLRTVLAERLIGRYPRFRHRLAVPPGLFARPRWVDDGDFDLDRHLPVRRTPRGREPLSAVLDELASTPLDPAHPLWCFTVLTDDRVAHALVARISHCVADGVALARVVLSLTDDQPDAPGAAEPPAAAAPAPRRVRFLRGSRGERTQPSELVRRAATVARFLGAGIATLPRLCTLPTAPRSVLRAPLTGEKRLAWSTPVPLAAIKALGRASGATVNDVLMNAITGALHRVVDEDSRQVRLVRAAVPVDLRDPAEPVGMGNRFGLVFLALPVGLADPDRRLAVVQCRMGAIKRSPEAVVTLAALGLLGVLPAVVQRAVIRLLGSKTTLVLTNVPGPRQPVYLAGARVPELQYWVPQCGGVGLGVSILSYAGQVTVGVAADRGVLADPRRVVTAFRAELDDLLRRAGVDRQDALGVAVTPPA